jgi:hypothetical protein
MVAIAVTQTAAKLKLTVLLNIMTSLRRYLTSAVFGGQVFVALSAPAPAQIDQLEGQTTQYEESIWGRLHTVAGLIVNPCGNASRYVRHNAALLSETQGAAYSPIFAATVDDRGVIFPFQDYPTAALAHAFQPAEVSRRAMARCFSVAPSKERFKEL